MAKFDVTISEMQAAAKSISQYNEEFRDAASQVKQATDAMIGSEWKSEQSSQNFQDNVTALVDWMNQMNDIVDTYAKMLETAAERYANADSTAAGFFHG